MNEMAKCSNRLRFVGAVWSSVTCCFLFSTFLRNMSLVKKIAVYLTSFHVGSISYRINYLIFLIFYKIE